MIEVSRRAIREAIDMITPLVPIVGDVPDDLLARIRRVALTATRIDVRIDGTTDTSITIVITDDGA